jgi:hypothetical protein
MNTGEIWGLIGGVGGGLLGLLGGIFGTYCSIRNTRGPRERAFMIKASVVCWLVVVLFVGLLFALPSPTRHFLWIPYVILLPTGTLYWNRKQRLIRQQESGNQRVDFKQ